MKKALDARLKADPLINPAGPQSPCKVPEYATQELEVAKRFDELSAQKHAAAQQANETSDTDVLQTVLFASVLFFGGGAGTLDLRRLRVILAMAVSFFAFTVVYLGTMPTCKE